MKLLKPLLGIIPFLLLTPSMCFGQNIYDTLRTVKMTALTNSQSGHLTIQWEDDPGINTYSLYKKMRGDTSWGVPLIITGDQDTSYLDVDIEIGTLYEYRMIKETGDSLGYAYLFSGVNYTPPQKKGDLLLLIDSVAAAFVQNKLTTYMDILVSEGWIPRLEILAVDASVQLVKSRISNYFESTDSLTTVLLLGNIAVPHSGNINPDAHSNHKGAWPADLYYGDIDGVWTDETVDNTSSTYPRIHNIPGDGNFDQDYIPSEIELIIGRLDFSELPVFDLDQYELLDNYLQKNIDYRTGVYPVKRRAVFKNTNPWVEGLGQNAIRNFVPIVSPDSIVYGDFFDAFYDSFLWSYGGSSGSMICSNGLGCIDTYADNNFQAIFTAYFGSYYGDYDFENNFLRTILASGKVLSTAWVGAPNWHFHPMAMGLDLGFCTLLTQNNTDVYYAGVFPQSVTINLLGDPTLKAFIVLPPSDLNAAQNGNHIQLSWSPSQDSILEYQVYRKYFDMDYFEAVNLLPVEDTHLIDSCVFGEELVQYLVKAVKFEVSPSGSFINYSNGPIISIQTNPSILPIADFHLSWEQGVLSGMNLSSNANQYQWLLPNGESTSDEHFEIPYNQNGTVNVSLIANSPCFSDTLQQQLFLTHLINSPNSEVFYLYPNPARVFFTIETRKHIDKLELFDALGVSILTEVHLSPGSHFINTQDFTEGVYLLKVYIDNQLISKKILCH